ncbi:MAG: tyrosine-protein phosphatase [Pseudooceanicola atlanticus]
MQAFPRRCSGSKLIQTGDFFVIQQRKLPFEGAANFRDLGGYPAGPGRQTRWHLVYRSDSLAELTEADLDRLDALDLFALFDFRLPDEAAQKPDRLPDGHAIRLANPGFLPENTDVMLARIRRGQITAAEVIAEVTGHYTLFAERHIANYRDYFRTLLEADGRPVLIHCTSGKDRTGWGSALTLLAAGCDDDTAARDYVLTDQYRRDVAFMFPGGVATETLDVLTSARRAYIDTALATLRRRHGPGNDWMAELGFDTADRQALQALLTEPTA